MRRGLNKRAIFEKESLEDLLNQCNDEAETHVLSQKINIFRTVLPVNISSAMTVHRETKGIKWGINESSLLSTEASSLLI